MPNTQSFKTLSFLPVKMNAIDTGLMEISVVYSVFWVCTCWRPQNDAKVKPIHLIRVHKVWCNKGKELIEILFFKDYISISFFFLKISHWYDDFEIGG